MKYIVHGYKNKKYSQLTHFGVDFWSMTVRRVEAGRNVARVSKLRCKVRNITIDVCAHQPCIVCVPSSRQMTRQVAVIQNPRLNPFTDYLVHSSLTLHSTTCMHVHTVCRRMCNFTGLGSVPFNQLQNCPFRPILIPVFKNSILSNFTSFCSRTFQIPTLFQFHITIWKSIMNNECACSMALLFAYSYDRISVFRWPIHELITLLWHRRLRQARKIFIDVIK